MRISYNKLIALGCLSSICFSVSLNAAFAESPYGASRKMKLRTNEALRDGVATNPELGEVSSDARAQLGTEVGSETESKGDKAFGATKRLKRHAARQTNDGSSEVSSEIASAGTSRDARAALDETAEVNSEKEIKETKSKSKFGASKKLKARRAW